MLDIRVRAAVAGQQNNRAVQTHFFRGVFRSQNERLNAFMTSRSNRLIGLLFSTIAGSRAISRAELSRGTRSANQGTASCR